MINGGVPEMSATDFFVVRKKAQHQGRAQITFFHKIPRPPTVDLSVRTVDL